MKDIDFPFFSDGNGEHNPFTDALNQAANDAARQVLKIKEQHLRVALIEIEGSFPHVMEIRQHGRVEQSLDGSQLVLWKGKPILQFGPLVWLDGKPAMKAKFLYV